MKKILFLFTLAVLAGVISINDAFADHTQVTITPSPGSGAPGCEESSKGCYYPKTATIDVGGKVIFSNTDTAAHTWTAGTAAEGPSGEFDTSLVIAGSSYEWTATTAGEFPYHCMVHPWMEGLLIVQQASYSPPNSQSSSYSGTVIASGTDIKLNYKISGGKIYSVTPDVEANSLIISIGANQDGALVITLPRTLIDAKMGSQDDTFFVLVNGDEVDFEESSTSRDRTLTIMFPVRTNEIEIIGTFVFSNSNNYPQPTPYSPLPSTPTHVPYGTNIVIPSGTGSPGCENSNSCYQPFQFSSGKGSTVTWYNADSAAHTVTSGNPSNGPDGAFDSSLMLSGSTFSHKFNSDGTYPYYCMVHPWMTGYVIVQRGGTIIPAPTPAPTPTPTPTTPGTISVSTDASQYSPGELVTVKIYTSKSANVAVSVIGPSGDSIVSRTVSTDSGGYGSLQFKLPDSSQNGSYRVDSTATISGKVSDSTTFSVKSTSSRVTIVSLQPTDQQGNAISSFTKGKLGFVKVVLNSDSNTNSLVTINLFDSELTSLGIGSFKTTLGSGQSEMTLSFFIPNDAKIGNGDIYANVFSDWPSQGGVPLTGESSTQVRIQ